MKPGYKQTEVGVIPEEWEVTALGGIGDVRMCKRIFKHQTQDYGDVPFYKIGTFGGAPDAYISLGLYEEYKRKYSFPRKGDVLISAAGTIGRTVVYNGDPAYFQDSNIVWIDNDRAKATNEYLWHYYKVIKWSVSDGGTVARLYNDNLKNKIHVAVPPLPEQEAIASALGDADGLIESLERLIAKKRAIKQGAMQELLTGRRRLPGFKGEWEQVEFGNVATIRNEKVMASSMPEETPCIELESIGSGTGRLTETMNATGVSSKYRFMKGDVLFGRLRSYLKKYWFAAFNGICSTEIWPIIPRGGRLRSEYLHLIVQTNGFTDAAGVSYGTHMPRSDWSIIRKYAIQLPQADEQTAIASVLSDMDAEIAALEGKLAKARAIKQGMMQELLTGRIRLV